MKKTIKGVEFINRPINEFITVANQYVYKNIFLDSFRENNIEISEKILNIIAAFDLQLSDFLKNEVNFFGKLASIEVCLFGFLDDFEEINTIDDYFEVFDKSSNEHLFNYIGGAFLSEYYKEDNSKWGAVKHSIPLMQEYIEEIKDIKKSLKKEILNLYKSPDETRMRIRYVIKAMYEVYKSFEEELNKRVIEVTEEFKKEYKENPELFLKEHCISESVDVGENKIFIQCTYAGLVVYRILRKKDGEIHVVIGPMSKAVYHMTKLNDNLDKFLKLISDKTRQKILKLLSEKEMYNQALAKELNLTPATVNYHMQNFLIIGLVTVNEKENKLYYRLDKEAANRYIDQLKQRLNL